MKIITNEEFNRLNMVTKVGTKISVNRAVLDEVSRMEIGQMAIIEKSEWKTKSKPSVLLTYAFRKTMKFSIRTIENEGGWVVTRIS